MTSFIQFVATAAGVASSPVMVIASGHEEEKLAEENAIRAKLARIDELEARVPQAEQQQMEQSQEWKLQLFQDGMKVLLIELNLK